MFGLPNYALWAIVSVAEKQGWSDLSLMKTTGPLLAIKNKGSIVGKVSFSNVTCKKLLICNASGHMLDEIRI